MTSKKQSKLFLKINDVQHTFLSFDSFYLQHCVFSIVYLKKLSL